MKQIIQNIKSGETDLDDIPIPRVGRDKVLIKTYRSLVSLGTEKMLVNFARANIIDKARQQPEKVKEVINKMKADGIIPTLESVFRKLDTPIPLGYSQAGEIVEIGYGVSEFQVGDRVISNGYHAEYVSVPKNLVAKIPDGVSFEEASFTVVGAIGLQGIRLVKPTFGETIVVIGLGLIGLITVQLLKANGCKVLGLDVDENKLKLAESFGAKAINPTRTDPVKFIEESNKGIGADAVIITASSKSNSIIKQAAQLSRKRGRIVLVGVIGLDIDRSDFFEKELTFQVSCSYGPGRYDVEYEQKGIDYPLPYVRWTEKRNFEAVLEAIGNGSINVKSLITDRVPLENYLNIYRNLDNNTSIASILEYPLADDKKMSKAGSGRTLQIQNQIFKGGKGTMAVIGSGNFTKAVIMPELKKAGASIKYLVSSGGLSSTSLAKKFGVPYSSTDFQNVLNDTEVDGIVITTQHNLHANMTVAALRAGKHVFVEKPLALNLEELNSISSAVEETGNSVSVGFNRRFSRYTEKMKTLLGNNGDPMNVIATMNAGYIPPEVWVHDLEAGGGRVAGEACHYIDLITFLTGSKVVSVSMQSMGKLPKINTDNVSIHLKYENGSLGIINYFANGHKSYSKERIEVYYQGKNLILDNFRRLDGFGFKKGLNLSSRIISSKQDKGHGKQFEILTMRWQEGGPSLIPFDEIINTTKSTFAALQSLREKRWIDIE